jgi:hypothetical protein
MVPQLILSFTLLFLFPAVSYSQTSFYENSGKWASLYLNDESKWAAVAGSEKSTDGYFAIRFDPQSDCEPEVTYSRPSPPVNERVPDGVLDRAMELRVDGNEVWVVGKGDALVQNGLSIDGTRATYSIHFYATFEFVLELTSGNYLRMLDSATEATERFSLSGSRVALSRAYSKCKEQIRSQVPSAPNPQPYMPSTPLPLDSKQLNPMQTI